MQTIQSEETLATSGPRILAVVLSYQTRDDTLECLTSLRDQKYQQLSVLIVDNNSGDDSVEAIRNAFPQFELLLLPSNLGWAGGNNAGIRTALGRQFDYVCLLNSDTIIGASTFESLAKASDCVGPCLLHPAIYYHGDAGKAQLDASTLRAAPDAKCGTIAMNFAYGACLMVHRSIFENVGMLDERFFLQLEEMDLYRRASKAGYRSYCCPDAQILHKVSASFGARSTPTKTYYITRNTLLLAEKHNFSTRGFLDACHEIYWSLSPLATEKGSVGSLPRFLLWLGSRDRFARAARMGIRDYLLRRFGRINERAALSLSAHA